MESLSRMFVSLLDETILKLRIKCQHHVIGKLKAKGGTNKRGCMKKKNVVVLRLQYSCKCSMNENVTWILKTYSISC